MRSTLRRVATLFIALAIITSGMAAFAGSATAATDTLAGDGTDNPTGFDANESDHFEYSLSADGTDFGTDNTTEVKLNVTYDGETYHTMTNDSIASGDASHTFNFSHAELDDLPGDAGENTTVTVNAWGEGADGSTNTSVTTFDVPITFDSSYAVASVDDDSATIEDVDGPGFFSLSTVTFWSESDEPADRHTYESTVGIDGANTTVTVLDETENGSDAFSDVIREDIESGDVIYKASVGADGTPIKAFYDEADSDKVSDGDTYAVYDSDANTWKVHTGDAQDGNSEMDIYISSQSYTSGDNFEQADLNSLFIDDLDMGLYSLGSNFGWTSLGSFSLLEAVGIGMIGTGGASLAGLGLFVGRSRLGA